MVSICLVLYFLVSLRFYYHSVLVEYESAGRSTSIVLKMEVWEWSEIRGWWRQQLLKGCCWSCCQIITIGYTYCFFVCILISPSLQSLYVSFKKSQLTKSHLMYFVAWKSKTFFILYEFVFLWFLKAWNFFLLLE